MSLNKRQASILHRIQMVAAAIAGMEPSNPCDTTRKSVIADIAPKACRHLYRAISAMGFRDYADAEEECGSAEQLLKGWRERVAELEARRA